jgi:hypothetical protein
VSLVDGFNLPMAIIPTAANCPVASCPIDLNPQCPAQLVGPRDPTGLVVGCNSACSAGLDNAGACLVPLFLLKSDFAFARGAADSANCCTGTHSTQTTCPSSGVDYYAYFSAYSSSPPSSTPVSPFLTSPYRPHPEGNCPNAYVYAFDGGSGTSLWTCPSTQYSDYKVTFCPCVLGLSSLLFVTLIDCCLALARDARTDLRRATQSLPRFRPSLPLSSRPGQLPHPARQVRYRPFSILIPVPLNA